MSRELSAKIGDFVEIYVHNGETLFYGTVQHVPVDVGDSWIILKTDGNIIHVLIFDTIEVVKRGENE